MPIKTLFLDRDGVLNRKAEEGDYIKSWEEFEFLPGVLAALRRLAALVPRIIVVTNQRGIALGRMTEADVERIHRRMTKAVAAAGGRIDAIYCCPHQKGACRCRKPDTGMYETAAGDFPQIRWEESLLVGDSLSDLEAAARLGCPAVLIAAGERGETIRKEAVSRALPVRLVAGSLETVASELSLTGSATFR